MKPTVKSNIEINERVMAALREERSTGKSITSTIEASVYWFLVRLSPADRDAARKEAVAWMKEGIQVESASSGA